jgi:hypothetical protein
MGKHDHCSALVAASRTALVSISRARCMVSTSVENRDEINNYLITGPSGKREETPGGA